jgi:hypothetical protein
MASVLSDGEITPKSRSQTTTNTKKVNTMTQVQTEEYSSPISTNLVRFPAVPATGRSLLSSAIRAYQEELKQITDVAPPNTWVVYPDKGKPKHRTLLDNGKVRQVTISSAQAAKWEQSRLRRERKQSLTVLIDELIQVLARGL